MERNHFACLILLALLSTSAASAPLGAAVPDACSARLPASLPRAIKENFPSHRLPRQSDSRSMCVAGRQREHRSTCLLVARGDFDGDGREDVAALLPNRHSKGAPKLVVALARGKGWRIEELRIGTDRFVNHFVIGTLTPGTYQETEEVIHTGKAPVVTSSSYGVTMSACDSWSNGYFRVKREVVVDCIE